MSDRCSPLLGLVEDICICPNGSITRVKPCPFFQLFVTALLAFTPDRVYPLCLLREKGALVEIQMALLQYVYMQGLPKVQAFPLLTFQRKGREVFIDLVTVLYPREYVRVIALY